MVLPCMRVAPVDPPRRARTDFTCLSSINQAIQGIREVRQTSPSSRRCHTRHTNHDKPTQHRLMKKTNHKSFQNSRLQVAASCTRCRESCLVLFPPADLREWMTKKKQRFEGFVCSRGSSASTSQQRATSPSNHTALSSPCGARDESMPRRSVLAPWCADDREQIFQQHVVVLPAPAVVLRRAAMRITKR